MTTNEFIKTHLKAWVMYQLSIRGLSFAELARQNGNVKRDVPGRVFYMSYPKWERIVAAAIDMKPEDLWPERWTARIKRRASLTSKPTRKRMGKQ